MLSGLLGGFGVGGELGVGGVVVEGLFDDVGWVVELFLGGFCFKVVVF